MSSINEHELVTCTIDNQQITVPKGTLIIRAAEQIGIEIPRFCDHPLLDPVACCRQCLVEIEGQRKLQPSCAVPVAQDMVVHTQHTSDQAQDAQHDVMELLLINHPLDCPTCDKGGECPLQNQAMAHGRTETRFEEVKRVFPKPINISSQILLDRDRCIMCARCVRFAKEIPGDPFIEMQDRGAHKQVGIYGDQSFETNFSGNVTQICPVGALTGASYRFRARPFDLVSVPTICEHCASGCAQRTDYRRNKIMRRLAGNDPEVNEEWNCDKGRWGFSYISSSDRLTTPLVRNDKDELVPTSWTHALAVAARGLSQSATHTAVLTGGRLTLEDAYGYAKFARAVLGTDDIDFRCRVHSDEETQFLTSQVIGITPDTGGITYCSLENAPVVLLVGLEPEEESPMVFLRLRKAFRKHHTKIYALSSCHTHSLTKIGATVLTVLPGQEGSALHNLIQNSSSDQLYHDLEQSGAIILVGERLAGSPGAFSAVSRLAHDTGAQLGWIPRRAGERSALEAGALPGILPGGYLLTDPHAREHLQSCWNTPLPDHPGRATSEILSAIKTGDITGLVVGGFDPTDLPDPDSVITALETASFLVSLEVSSSEVTKRANVVLPVAPVAEKSGTFINWEGRLRQFPQALPGTGILSDSQVLTMLAEEMGSQLGLDTIEAARKELDHIGHCTNNSISPPDIAPPPITTLQSGQAILATWKMLIDCGTMTGDDPNLADLAHQSIAYLCAQTADQLNLANGDQICVYTDHGSISLPLVITSMPANVVWIPMNSPNSMVHTQLGVTAGAVVQIGRAS